MSDERDDELALEAGGPSWRIWLRTGLAPAEVLPLGRRALLLAGLCWLPPLLLSLAAGTATGDSVRISFLHDFAAYARFLVAIVLLVLADAAVAGRLRQALRQFRIGELIPPSAEPGFVAAIAGARRRVNSTALEIALLGLAGVGSWVATRRSLADGVSTWRVLADGSGESLSAAGWWCAIVSVPLFLFLFLRWVFRGYVWASLLASISRLDLRLVATHPDRAAGLGFLSLGQGGFAILVLAFSASLSSSLANQVVFQGVELESLYPILGAFGAIAILLALGPLFAFAPRLARLKREALDAYGALSSRHDSAFAAKWLGGDGSALLGDPDASSLADLAAGYQRVRELRPIPLDTFSIVPLALAAVLPMLPLIATKVPLTEILKGLIHVVM